MQLLLTGMYRNYKGHFFGMDGKMVFSAVLVKIFKIFHVFPITDGESGQSCGVLDLERSGWPR